MLYNIDVNDESDMLEEETAEEEFKFTSIKKTVKTIYYLTKTVYDRLTQIQDNFQKIIALSSKWNEIPMYSREKTTKLIKFDDRLTKIKTIRCTEVQDASKKIQKLLKEDLLLFFSVPLVDKDKSKLILLYCSLKY